MLIRSNRTLDKSQEPVQAGLLASLGMRDIYDQFPWPLPNMKPCDGDSIWRYRSHYNFCADVWLDFQLPDGRHATLILSYISHGHNQRGGFAVLVHRGHYPQPSVVEYFTWSACEHTYKEERAGRCQHKYTCTKCGAVYAVDSSG